MRVVRLILGVRQMKQRFWVGVAIVVVTALGAQAAVARDKPSIGVAEFRNESGAGWWRGGVGWELSGMLANELAATRKYQVMVVGDLGLLPADCAAELTRAATATRPVRGMHVNVAVSYGGRHELRDAVRGTRGVVRQPDDRPGRGVLEQAADHGGVGSVAGVGVHAWRNLGNGTTIPRAPCRGAARFRPAGCCRRAPS